MSVRLVDQNVTRLIAVVGGLADIHAATAAEINAGVNITCGMAKGYTLGMQESSSVSGNGGVCDEGNTEARGIPNYTGNLQLFVEKDATDADSPILRAYELFKDPGVIFDLVRLIGKPSTTPVTDGEEYEAYGFESDYIQKMSGTTDGGWLTWPFKLFPTGRFEHAGIVVAA
jgi:hypothetical protein